MVYKSLEDIIDVIHSTVDIIKPVYNFKALEGDVPWKKGKVNNNGETDSK